MTTVSERSPALNMVCCLALTDWRGFVTRRGHEPRRINALALARGLRCARWPVLESQCTSNRDGERTARDQPRRIAEIACRRRWYARAPRLQMHRIGPPLADATAIEPIARRIDALD